MEDNYIKEKKIKDLSREMKNEELLLNVMKTKLELEVARNNYEYAEDELVDYFAYQIKAIQAKLDYFYSTVTDLAKFLGLSTSKPFSFAT